MAFTCPMSKIRCLVTAGPTREFFDPVRFISNPSSGKMGVAIAKAAAEIGWDVSLILGPVALMAPKNIKTVGVISADDMLREAAKRFPDCDILIMAAAVSDMRPKVKADQKVKKEALSMIVEFEPTPDILKILSSQKKNQILIGFAAETENISAYAKKKLSEKNLDAIAANSVASAESGFGSENNAIALIMKDGREIDIPFAPKPEAAKCLIEILNSEFFTRKP